MSSKPHITRKEIRDRKKEKKRNCTTNGDTSSNNCVLGRQNWPELTASHSGRGRSNNARDDDRHTTTTENDNNIQQREYG